jgi:hypothetical protein
MPDPADTYFYVGEFIALILAMWAMMLILDQIWPSNYERDQAEKKANAEKARDATRPYKPTLP